MTSDPQSVPASKPATTTFFGDVLRLASGTGLAQLIAIAAAPFLTRLYLPEDYGVAALFVSITAVIGVVACLRYELSIVLPDDDGEAINLVAVSILSAVAVAGLCVPFVWAVQKFVVFSPETNHLTLFLWLMPVYVLLQGLYRALSYWNTRKQKFARLSVASVSGALATASAQFGAAFMGQASGGALIVAKVLGQSVAIAALVIRMIREAGNTILRELCWRGVIDGLKRHRKFPIYGSFAAVLNALSWQLPVLMLGAFFSQAAVGYYALGFQLLYMPMALIGGSISQVFFQRAAAARKDGTLPSVVLSLFEGLTVVCLFPMLALAIVGQDLFSFVFGSRWAEAGVYTQILSVWAFVWFVSSPLSTMFAVFEKQEQGLVVQVIIFASRLLSLAIGAYFGDPRIALAIFSFAGVVAYGYLAIKIFGLAGIGLRKPLGLLANQLVISAPFLLPIAAASFFGMSSIYILALAIILGIAYLLSQKSRAQAIINLRVSTND